jgi:2-methylcitrate dehydratase PrpD
LLAADFQRFTAIELGVAKPVLRTIAEPPEAKARPASGYHAAFSGPYTVAAALLGGGNHAYAHPLADGKRLKRLRRSPPTFYLAKVTGSEPPGTSSKE